MANVIETTVCTDSAFLDFEKVKTQAITLNQLERTAHENDVYGNPLKGMYHFQVVKAFIDMCNEYGYNVEIYDMFAAQNRDKNTPGVTTLPLIEARMNQPKAVEAHILRRVFTNMRLTAFDDDTYTTNLAIGYHQKGIQVGFGRNVKICHNQCMLNPECYVSTYSERGKAGNKVDLAQLLETVRMWLKNAKELVEKEDAIINRMKKIVISPEKMYQIIGMLTTLRVSCDSSIKEIRTNATYPLNSAQINQLTEDMLVKYNQNNVVTVWDLYNSATEMYKAPKMDIPMIMPQNRSFVSFLNEQFDLYV